ncbi:bifunctional UDP-N-acetylglucosamine diphosphorylase/glucosamine-1-phosphate N-acetyltransferase GlmU [Enterococcus timonensis]|uniref:bifunctional UDP-N-acetylglucosamine diphosphorylase/glucosamine-1-phosphate N-acetyltransferase GlmU n=1 Tax=Enterococcus timonensis TaxID=1852364 RepID=UPI0009F4F5A1|nr:bifunctional UDP-N-acetylglucosamine diphosphorylase/glucosamine-1-phosphate N-acetyltransferase GlmU [Enterococcus timonensis]
MDRFVIILAAGQGTRMKSKLYKVLHPVCGKSMVNHVVSAAEELQPEKIITIVGFGAEKVQAELGDRVTYVLQEQQLGTGHAVLQTKSLLEGQTGTTVVLSGDAPLLTAGTIENLFADHQKYQRGATILTALAENPTGYGRIVRDEAGAVEKIVEQKDADEKIAAIHEVNTGTYCFDNELLFEALKEINTENAQGEYYLTDIIEILKKQNKAVGAMVMEDFSESMGVNDRLALAEATSVMQRRINNEHMKNGVTMIDPQHTYIDIDVTIGSDTVIEGGVTLKGQTKIGADCLITTGSALENAMIEDGVVVRSSAIEDSIVRKNADVGPFAHLRPQSDIGEHVHIGNFVEVKKSTVDTGTKIGHLTYVGDATLGKNINIGCGTIFVNYDGKNKHHTNVGDNVFIGCNANLVAPLSIGENAFIAAGSTITKDVPAAAMAIARSRQENKLDYAKKLPYQQ